MPVYELQQMVDATTDALVAQLSAHMPDCAYRDFYQWSFSEANSGRSYWVQTIGMTQLVKLTINLYQGLVPDEQIPELVDYCIPINIYQNYEIVSDNLGIGLAHPLINDTGYSQRCNLLLSFNKGMIERLSSQGSHAQTLLAPVQHLGHDISAAKQSLSPDKHRLFIQLYTEAGGKYASSEIEHAIWPFLVANIESSADVIAFTEKYRVGALIKQGFIQRYQAVSDLIESTGMSLDKRVHVSTHAILVAPILAYFIGGLEEIGAVPDIQPVIQNETLAEACYLAAQLIRLLNDLGTGLVMQTAEERTEFINGLRQRPALSLSALLSEAINEYGALLTRIDKDLRHGEFNLAFFDLLDMESLPDALDTLENRLTHYSRLYAESRERLWELLSEISLTLGDDRASQVIARCLIFHEQLYANSFQAAEGEYAV